MAYAAFSVTFGEQPSAAKWNILGTNDAGFNDGTLLPTVNSDTATVATAQTSTSTSFTDLATVGPQVTVTVGTTGKLLVCITAVSFNSGAGNRSSMAFALSGANTLAAAATNSIYLRQTADHRISGSFLLEALTPGSTTVTAKYSVSAGTGQWEDRILGAIPF